MRPELHQLFRATAGRALPHTNVYDDQLRLLTRLEDKGTHLNINRFTLRQHLPHAEVVDAGLVHLYGRIPLTPETRALFEPEMFAVFSMMVGPDRTMAGFAPVDYPEPVADAGELQEVALGLVDGWHPLARAMVEHWDVSRRRSRSRSARACRSGRGNPLRAGA
ncbi:hypothetical protein ACIRSS_33870 [Amycolatopsis sp. NPDC101161]|uniref:hypothetical protein n=1 Tax=Amycolatopsis sp. NPDC101161 TaxID=3363940 RepID=UPI003827CD10